MKQFTLAFILLALLMAPACDTLDEIELSEEPQPTFVTPVYNDNEDGTITDTTSNGVMWETCPYDFSGGTCGIGSFATKNYTDALTVCEGKTTGSYADWRLPTKAELSSLSYNSTVYNNGFFPKFADEIAYYWWSSTQLNDNSYFRVKYDPDNLDDDHQYVDSANYVRCARSIQP